MIPARIGSTRLPMKNLALLDGRPLIVHVIEAARDAGVFDRIVLNSDSEIFRTIAQRCDVEFYGRPAALGSSTTQSDDVVLDFMEKHSAQVVAWVNPISPLQTGREIRGVVRHFLEQNLDSLITVLDEHVHCVFEGAPVNFQIDEKFTQTQDLVPVERFVYSVMMWKTDNFVTKMGQQDHAFLSGRVGYYRVSKLSSIIIKTEEDLRMANALLAAIKADQPVDYDPLATFRPGHE